MPLMELWQEIRSGEDASQLAPTVQSMRRELLRASVSDAGCVALRSELDTLRVGGFGSALRICHLLEQATPLCLLHLILRRGARNELRSGLRQSYGDHTRTLCLAIDKAIAGDTDWLASRCWPGEPVQNASLLSIVGTFSRKEVDGSALACLFMAAALHDYGKLFGRRNGLDPEDGCAIIGSDILPLLGFATAEMELIRCLVRNHDLVEFVWSGSTPTSFLSKQMEPLAPEHRALTGGFLGLIQVLGASSLGEGRITAGKIRIFEECLAQRCFTLHDEHGLRLAQLISPVTRPKHGFASLRALEHAVEGVDEGVEKFLQKVVLHGWDEHREEIHSTNPSDTASHILLSHILTLAEIWSSTGARAEHVVIAVSGSEQIRLGLSSTLVATQLGSRVLIVGSGNG